MPDVYTGFLVSKKSFVSVNGLTIVSAYAYCMNNRFSFKHYVLQKVS
jgi:hypothetical protein